MVEYVFLNSEEASVFVSNHPADEKDSATMINLSACKNAKKDDIICIAAVDKGCVIGRMLFTYGFIADGNKPLRVAAAQALMVSKKRQGEGIGGRLIKKSLEINILCIHSGLSGAAIPLFKKLGFSFIDDSPVFQAPLSMLGVFKDARHRFYAMKKNNIRDLFTAFFKSMSIWKQVVKKSSKYHVLDKQSAIDMIDEILSVNVKRFQIPWNMDKVKGGINGVLNDYYAFVVESNTSERYFVSIYIKHAQFRLPLTDKLIAVKDGHVNEIYPPINDPKSALSILNTIAIHTRQLGYKNLSVYASTPVLLTACQSIGLDSRHNKTFAIKPINLQKELSELITDPSQWWCRAMNEDQVEEAQGQQSHV